MAWRRPRAGQLPCVAHLAEDLALAEHGRVEPGRDLEQVGDGGLVVLAVEVRVQLVGASPPSSQKKSRMSAYAPWNRSATAYTSVRLQVLRTTASRMFSRLVRPWTAFGSSSAGIATRSSSASGRCDG